MTMTITNEFLKCELSYVLDDNNNPWFSGKGVGIVLGYTNPQKSLRDHVDDDDKEKLSNLRVNETPPPDNQPEKQYLHQRIGFIFIDNVFKVTNGESL